MGPLETKVRDKVSNLGNLMFWELYNESASHARGQAESHFKLVLVSEDFKSLSSVQRHQKIFEFLKDEVAKIHSFSLDIYAPDEWDKKAVPSPGPGCQGKGR